MASLPETTTFDAGVYQLETTDPVLGGVSGVSNSSLKNLANRTNYLKAHLDALEAGTAIPATVAPLSSPTFTDSPRAPTAPSGDNGTLIATTAFAQNMNSGFISKSVAGNTNVTLSAVECGRGIIELTGALTGNIAVIVPNAFGKWVFQNHTTGAFTVTLKTAAGVGFVIAQAYTEVAICDATNVYGLTAVNLSGGFVNGTTATFSGGVTAAGGFTGNLAGQANTVASVTGASGNIAGQAGTVVSVTGASGNIAGSSGSCSGTSAYATNATHSIYSDYALANASGYTLADMGSNGIGAFGAYYPQATTTSDATRAGSTLLDGSGAVQNGTWRNVQRTTITAGILGNWQRIA
jgi:hypothetical protein